MPIKMSEEKIKCTECRNERLQKRLNKKITEENFKSNKDSSLNKKVYNFEDQTEFFNDVQTSNVQEQVQMDVTLVQESQAAEETSKLHAAFLLNENESVNNNYSQEQSEDLKNLIEPENHDINCLNEN